MADDAGFAELADRAFIARTEPEVLAALAAWPAVPAQRADSRRDVARLVRLLDLAADLAQPVRAVAYLQQAIEADPHDRSRYAWIARLLDDLHRPHEAQAWRERAVVQGD